MHTDRASGTIRKKMMISYYMTSVSILVLTVATCYYFFHYQMKHRFQYRLLSIAKTAALFVDGDKHLQLRNRNDEKSKFYLHIKAILQNFKKANPDIKNIYTMRKTGKEGIWEFVVDVEEESSDDFSHLGDKYDVSGQSEMKKAFAGPIVDEEFKTDQWGTFLSGYAPILDHTGNAVAIVGVDVSADAFLENQKDILKGAALIFIISIALTAYTTQKRISLITNPINQIIDGAKQVSAGNLNYRLQLNTNDEFDIMVEMLNKTADVMVDYQRMLEKDLAATRNQKEKMFKIYGDVIYSVTQGKFNLIGYKEAIPLYDEGELYDRVELKQPEDVNKARELTERFFSCQGVSHKKLLLTKLCVSEAATNVIKHAENGTMQLIKLPEQARVIISDQGPGMDFDKLPNMILFNGFSTKTSMGFGFTLIYKYADKIYLSSSENGTFLAMDFNLS